MKPGIAEKFLILAHHPEKGRFKISDVQITYGIIGALLLEMSLENCINVENGRVIITKKNTSENQLTSEIIKQIAASEKHRKLSYWMSKLSRRSGAYKWAILQELEKRGIVRIEGRKFLGIIPYRKSFLTDSLMRDNLIQQIKSCILFHKEMNDENIAVSGLIEACQMHRIITNDRDELKTLRKELKQVLKDSPVASTVSQTIRQVQAAIITSVMAASVASSAASSH